MGPESSQLEKLESCIILWVTENTKYIQACECKLVHKLSKLNQKILTSHISDFGTYNL